MSDRRSVQIRAEIYEQIVPTVKAATGIVPNVTEFVTSAVAEKLEQYKLAGSTASSQKGRKPLTNPGTRSAAVSANRAHRL